MRIYVDFDDCLCETGRAFSKLVLEMFNKNVPSGRCRERDSLISGNDAYMTKMEGRGS